VEVLALVAAGAAEDEEECFLADDEAESDHETASAAHVADADAEGSAQAELEEDDNAEALLSAEAAAVYGIMKISLIRKNGRIPTYSRGPPFASSGCSISS
jgi:hypothetical protein